MFLYPNFPWNLHSRRLNAYFHGTSMGGSNWWTLWPLSLLQPHSSQEPFHSNHLQNLKGAHYPTRWPLCSPLESPLFCPHNRLHFTNFRSLLWSFLLKPSSLSQEEITTFPFTRSSQWRVVHVSPPSPPFSHHGAHTHLSAEPTRRHR